MIVTMQRKAVNLTGQILRELWDGNTRHMAHHINNESVMMDSLHEGQLNGVNEILEFLRSSNFGILKGDIVTPDFKSQLLSEDTCIVYGTYTVQSVPGSSRRFTQRHQLSILYQQIEDELFIRLYQSALMNGDEADEFRAPSNDGTHEYTTMLQRIRDERAIYPITDHKGRKYLLESADILTIESDRNYIIVTRADGEPSITVRMPFKEFMKQMPEHFVVITRGKAVNFDYVESMHRNALVLVDGSQHTISRLYASAVRNHISSNT